MKTKIPRLILCASVGALIQTSATAGDHDKTAANGKCTCTCHEKDSFSRLESPDGATISENRRPRQGLGAQDLTLNHDNAQRGNTQWNDQRGDGRSGRDVTTGSGRFDGNQNDRYDRNVNNPQTSRQARANSSEESQSFSSQNQRNMSNERGNMNYSDPKGYDRMNEYSNLAHDRRPRQGLGAEDLTQGSYASSDRVMRDPAGANNARFNYQDSNRTDDRRKMDRDHGWNKDSKNHDSKNHDRDYEVKTSVNTDSDDKD